jgi:hypothetical protein
MLSPMKRLIRRLALAGFITGAALTSLTAWGDSPPLPDPTGPAPNGPLPATTNPNQAAPSAEPPSPSEYNAAADADPSALADFHDTLAPYGTWVDDSSYGTVWVPSSTVVGADFAPYVSDGHWGLTEDSQWLWASDYGWGWAPFHYGRWVWIGGRGWAWIPGRVYSPAWVVWRTGYYDDYYVGWAPMPPTWYWWGGAAVGFWYVPPASYVFCSSRYVFAPRVRGYIVPAGRVAVIGPRTQTYVAANAGVVTGANYHPSTRGPSIADAHIPATAVPATRVSPDARALAFSHPSSAQQLPARPIAPPVQPGAFNRTPSFAQRAAPNFSPRPVAPSPVEVARPAVPSFIPSPRAMPPAAAPAPRSFSPPTIAPRSNPAPAVRSSPSMNMRGGRR